MVRQKTANLKTAVLTSVNGPKVLSLQLYVILVSSLDLSGKACFMINSIRSINEMRQKVTILDLCQQVITYIAPKQEDIGQVGIFAESMITASTCRSHVSLSISQ